MSVISVLLGQMGVGMGESLEACRPDSLAFTEANNKMICLKGSRNKNQHSKLLSNLHPHTIMWTFYDMHAPNYTHENAHTHKHTQTCAYKNKIKSWNLLAPEHRVASPLDHGRLCVSSSDIVTTMERGGTVAPVYTGWISLNKLLSLSEPWRPYL